MQEPTTPGTALRRARHGSVAIDDLPRAELELHLPRHGAAQREEPAGVAAGSSSHESELQQAEEEADFGPPLVASEVEFKTHNWAWIKDTSGLGYVLGRQVREHAAGDRTYALVTEEDLEGARRVRVKANDVYESIHSWRVLRTVFSDMVGMEEVNEATILHNLRRRFAGRRVYTSIGTILISVNPFEWMDWYYGPEFVDRYHALPAGAAAPPHIYATANNAYKGLLDDRCNQAIIISGESGAGKTEATKKCLQHLAHVAGGGQAGKGVAARLLAANPILEAFGNAKTVRNNNSSRFGKWMSISFDGHGRIAGCGIINYLLEKSRIVAPAAEERTYHIFYQLLSGADLALRRSLRLPGTMAECALLCTTTACLQVDRMDDRAEWRDSLAAMGQLGLTDEEQAFLFRVAAMVLHLCNLRFGEEAAGAAASAGIGVVEAASGLDADQLAAVRLARAGQDAAGPAATEPAGDASVVLPEAHGALESAAALLGVGAEALGVELCSRVRSVRREQTRSPLSPRRAAEATASLAKALYGRMFDWLVSRVNSALNDGSESDESESTAASAAASAAVPQPAANPAHTSVLAGKTIGILDIFGFEIFERNSFEQLCINFCNEKLQQHFNTHVFKEEEKCYRAEGIDYSEIEFVDNQSVLDLIEKRPGLLPMLDDETKLPQQSDANYLSRVSKSHAANQFLVNCAPGAAGAAAATPRRGRGASVSGGLDTGSARLPFGVRHYAGVVIYDATGFVDKNKDELYPNLEALVLQSEHEQVRSRLAERASAPGSSAARRSRRTRGNRPTQGAQFREQLSDLMRTLDKAAPHYVRCIKPNGAKQAWQFDGALCLEQLRYSGVFEAVRVRQQGFPFRYTYKEFYRHYAHIARPALTAVERQVDLHRDGGGGGGGDADGEEEAGAAAGAGSGGMEESELYRHRVEALLRLVRESGTGLPEGHLCLSPRYVAMRRAALKADRRLHAAVDAGAEEEAAAAVREGMLLPAALSEEARADLAAPRFKLGRSMVLYRAAQHRHLLRLREASAAAHRLVAQAAGRAFLARLDVRRQRALRRRLRAAIAGFDEHELRDAVADGVAVVRGAEAGPEGRLPRFYASPEHAGLRPTRRPLPPLVELHTAQYLLLLAQATAATQARLHVLALWPVRVDEHSVEDAERAGLITDDPEEEHHASQDALPSSWRTFAG